jgi:hypothetical protein
MSDSTIFKNGNFQQTPLNVAYQFQSFSNYINNNGLQTRFSSRCIFCPSVNTTALLTDGSFRKCNVCKKQFKAKLV